MKLVELIDWNLYPNIVEGSSDHLSHRYKQMVKFLPHASESKWKADKCGRISFYRKVSPSSKDTVYYTGSHWLGRVRFVCCRFKVFWCSCSRGFHSPLLRAHSRIRQCGLEPGWHVVYFLSSQKRQQLPFVSFHNTSFLQIHCLWWQETQIHWPTFHNKATK